MVEVGETGASMFIFAPMYELDLEQQDHILRQGFDAVAKFLVTKQIP